MGAVALISFGPEYQFFIGFLRNFDLKEKWFKLNLLGKGGVGERPKPPVWSTGEPRGSVGSNPTPSAKPMRGGG